MGTQYVNELIDDLQRFMGVEKIDTLPGIHEENSIVERRNKEVVRHVKAIVNHRKIKHQWSDVLPMVQRIINAEILYGLNVSPAQILFGNAITLDKGIFLENIPKTRDDTTIASKAHHLSEWMSRMLKAQADIIDIAQESQLKSHVEYFERFPTGRTEFPIGSYVLVNYGENRPPSKLHTYSRGPYRVVKQDEINPNRITVQNLVTSKLEDFPNKQLRPFEVDERHMTPTEAAMMDEDYEIVTKVLSHTPKKLHGTPKGKIFFQVQYAGDEANNKPPSKVSYSLLRDNEVLHDYLRSIKAVSLIPAKYKWGREGPPPGYEEDAK